LRRREALGLLAAALPLAAARAADSTWHDVDVTGTSPSLEFTLQATPDGKRVT
jgi:protein SCO1/2